jgi:hypothetical protein
MFRTDSCRTFALCFFTALAGPAFLTPTHLRAQDNDNPKPESHGRKYKAPPDTSFIEVTVLKGFNKKPIDGAHVILHPVKDGKDEGSLEIKTHPDGKVVIDVIPTGSKVTIQVFADGFATFAQDYQIDEASRQIVISMERPKAQISAYVDNSGKESQRQPGVQEPVRPKPATKPPASNGTSSGASGGSSAAPSSPPPSTAPQN